MALAGIGFRQAIVVLEGRLPVRRNRGLVIRHSFVELVFLHFLHSQSEVRVGREGSLARLELLIAFVRALPQLFEQYQGSTSIPCCFRQHRSSLIRVWLQQLGLRQDRSQNDQREGVVGVNLQAFPAILNGFLVIPLLLVNFRRFRLGIRQERAIREFL